MKSFLAPALMSLPLALVNGACSDSPAYVGKQKAGKNTNKIEAEPEGVVKPNNTSAAEAVSGSASQPPASNGVSADSKKDCADPKLISSPKHEMLDKLFAEWPASNLDGSGKQKFASEVNRIILPGVTSNVVDMHGACERGECVGTERGGLTDANIAAAAAAVQARTATKFSGEIVSTKLKPISKHIPDPNKPTKGWIVQWGSFIHKSSADQKISEVVFSYGGWTFGEDTHFAAYWVVPQRTDIPTECL